ncbi:MBL fold metallo-hydrolase [Natronorubrum daqingense]|uniref:Glyoxylase, beta-lactamase superfamily II n=1 Tax=Natronorubrum daqingense TaxID=588898 RepID=A0A1N7CTN3_9EURY|nr:rhodanese-like domain-containing protein [Natronorubrum daqingense]APX97054.1 rhodanese [Natronorubrum daqingense]SIR66900.1 Glyoxylase, beta-lactamase superfamily II [Natronorubrum daqingense]
MVTTLSADRLAALLDEDEEFTLVDTRPEESYKSWHMPGALHFPFGPEEELNGRLEEFEETVGDAERVITTCAKGISSGNLATQLESATDEYDVQTVDGGMEGWSGVYSHVEIETDERGGDGLTVVQVQRRAKGCLGYVVGCARSGEAVVVDPTADIDEYQLAAEEAGLTIAGVIDTHVHADHISGGRDLADRLEVPYYLGERATGRDVEVEFTPLERNEVVSVGEREVKAVLAPGHTSEMINLLVDDVALLSADTLHVDSTGRTELEFDESESEDDSESNDEPAKSGETGARLLYESLHRTLLAEPESILVLPGHVTVTADGEFEHGSPGEAVETTIRTARTEIDLLDLEEEEFVDRMADAGEKPANYEEIIDLNRGAKEAPPEERTELELGPNNCSA